MARNEEKHFCNLNRLYLLKEKEEYEKIHPPRPRLNTLDTPEEIQKWLPSIKRDIDFYLKKSQVTCYSDVHIEECREKVVKLEKEFKAFVRKIKQLAPSPLDVIPWTSRPYKRRKTNTDEETSCTEFKRIATPILDNEKNNSLSVPNENSTTPPRLSSEASNLPPALKEDDVFQYNEINWNLMDQPLSFSTVPTNQNELAEVPSDTNVYLSNSNFQSKNYDFENYGENQNTSMRRTIQLEKPFFNATDQKVKDTDFIHKIVNYDSSDDESS